MSVDSSQQLLLDTHGDTIRALALEIRAATHAPISCRDLFHIGVEGMLDAARRYDPEVGEVFWTFAYRRVRGAMIDAIRLEMPVPPYAYRRCVLAEAALRATAPHTRAREEAEQQLLEATERVGLVSPESLAIVRDEALGIEDGRLNGPLEEESDERPWCPHPSDDGSSRVMRVDQVGADEQIEEAQRNAALHAALRQLTLEERMIIHGLYFEGRGLLDEELGHSKSWSSRIHTRALRRLRKMLAREWAPEARRDQPWGTPHPSADAVAVPPEAVVETPIEADELHGGDEVGADGSEIATAA